MLKNKPEYYNDLDKTYKNFCVVEGKIKSIEWLYLASKGHRRAIFIFENDNLDKKWLIP